jgi:hypothetical protein
MTTMRRRAASRLDELIAAGVPIRKGKRVAAASRDLADDLAAADRAVDRSAEIDRLGHHQHVLAREPAHEAVHECLAHQT